MILKDDTAPVIAINATHLTSTNECRQY